MTLIVAFALTAFVYSLAGFAGGTTYLALLTFSGFPLAHIAPLALICNLVVSTSNALRYLKAKLLRARLLVPHMTLSVPLAYLGGRMEIGKLPFLWLTALCLTAGACVLLIQHRRHHAEAFYRPPPLWIAVPAGGGLGFLSGVVGIGGGIFLSPLLYLLKGGSPREIAATCTFFIWLNSLAGLAGQWHKLEHAGALLMWWPLPAAVLTGGLAGNYLTVRQLGPARIAQVTGALLLTVAVKLWWDIFTCRL